jgi:hypothetical protein
VTVCLTSVGKEYRMRLGLVTDVHNHARELAQALTLFAERGVNRVVTIGDTCDAFGAFGPGDGAATEVAELLSACGAVGVWGNHDFVLCGDVTPKVRSRFPAAVFQFMARMQPQLLIDECYFSHKESSVDPHDVLQLWDISDRPLDLMERARSAFAAVSHRWQFIGHYHRWWAATPSGPVGWDGSSPLVFERDQRYLVIVAAVFDGWCGILDTDARCLQPLRCTRQVSP